MLIEAHYQQERVKNLAAKQTEKKDTADKDESSNSEIEKDSTSAGGNVESNIIENEATAKSSESDDVEMTDLSNAPITIKTEPEDDSQMNANTESSTENDNNSEKMSMDDDDSGSEQVIKAEVDEIDTVEKSNKNEEPNTINGDSGADANDKSIKVEEVSTTDDDDPYSKDINIDPRTYCKLGHFHLLLEDYSKGKCFVFVHLFGKNCFFLTLIYLSINSNVGISEVFRFG